MKATNRRESLAQNMSSVPEGPSHFGLYIRSIFRWKASVYKLIWKEFIIYMLIYLGVVIIQNYSRWIILCWCLTFRLICRPLRNKYPDLESLMKTGLLLPHELSLLKKHHSDNHPLIVLDWAMYLLQRCNKQNCFNVPVDLNRNVDAILAFKKSCGNILKFSSKNIPFALIQAVTITVYTFGIASLFSRQLSNKNKATTFIIAYFPILNSFQYFLYYLWLKFGRLAANPFGDDEDDIDICALLQAHIEDAARIERLFYNCETTNELVNTSIQSRSYWEECQPRREYTETDPMLTIESRVGDL